MVDIGKALRDEIARVAIREGNKLIAESKKLMGEVKREIAELRQQLAKVEKGATSIPTAPAAKKAPAANKTPAAKKATAKKPAAKKPAAKKPAAQKAVAVTVAPSAAAVKKPAKAKPQSAAQSAAKPDANLPTFTPAGIKSLRNRLGLSQEDFGVLCGVSKKSISTWELSKAAKLGLRAGNLERLAKVKEMSAAEAKPAVVDAKKA